MGNNEHFEVGKMRGYGDALVSRSALQHNSPDNYKYSVKPTNKYAKGGYIENLQKELYRLQRELNSSRLGTYREGDNSEEQKNRQKERAVKLARFNEVLALLREDETTGESEGERRMGMDSMAKGGIVKKKGKSQPAVTSNAVQPKYADYNVQLVESQNEINKGNYYMFPKPADKNSKGILFEKGGYLDTWNYSIGGL